MIAEPLVWRRSEPLVVERKLDPIADIELCIETQARMRIAAFDLQLAGMAVGYVLGSAIGDCYENLD